MSWRERRDQSNSGYAAYIGTKRIAWALDEAEVIQRAVEAVKSQPTKRRFVPTVSIFDCSLILTVAFVTDDANGVTVHRRNQDAGATMAALSY